MQEEINEFVEALYRFVANEIKRVTDPIYCQEGIKIVDARNHIFRLTDTSRTDEAEDTYALPVVSLPSIFQTSAIKASSSNTPSWCTRITSSVRAASSVRKTKIPFPPKRKE